MAELKKIPKIPISFKKGEEDLYNFIKSKRNASCYIKDLVEKDMNVNREVTMERQTSYKNNDFGFDF